MEVAYFRDCEALCMHIEVCERLVGVRGKYTEHISTCIYVCFLDFDAALLAGGGRGSNFCLAYFILTRQFE